ncbi:VOC family protein [Rhizobium sp. Leaf453]|uniref:VOC family protein n=1 Tax=Rhizobium sp. Leaf453 TaxID=1736380 RepID=UPI00071483E7|nr:VOC family protein [Rhizobium sp. Leaf453]KQT91900.1 lactoylglutathione lyase [Rhizobium sp. Leaf453]
MSAYATVGALDHDKSVRFYDAALTTIGWDAHATYPGWRGYSLGGSGQGFVLWVCEPFNSEPAVPGNGTMIGFMAKSHAEVDAFYDAALKNGGSDEAAPGPRPQYGPDWYSAYLRDPAGNKLAIVFNG